VSGPDTQQAPPPPPPPPSGSPFGRFLTSPVLLAGIVALVVGFAILQYSGRETGGGSAAPAASIAGSWATPPTGAGSEEPVAQLEVARSGGTLAVDNCTGDLTPRETASDDKWVFSYADTSGKRGCPRRMIVTVSLVDRNTLRVAARRPGGRVEFADTVNRVG
jgi:hypothetical protein